MFVCEEDYRGAGSKERGIRKEKRRRKYMSMPRGTKIICPNCNAEGNFVMWHSINVDVNPETRTEVKNRQIFKYECKNCGNVFEVEYSFLYHDVTNKFMIWYFPKRDYDIDKEIEEVNRENLIEKFNEKIRIVDDKRDLIEKINIFEDGLNDIGIEMIKYIIGEQLQDKSVEVFYNGMNDGMINFWMTDNKGAGYPYDAYVEMMKDYIFNEPQNCAIVNSNTFIKYIVGR